MNSKLASQNKLLPENWKKLTFKLSIEGSKLFLHLISLNGYMIYDETYHASMHQRFGIR